MTYYNNCNNRNNPKSQTTNKASKPVIKTFKDSKIKQSEKKLQNSPIKKNTVKLINLSRLAIKEDSVESKLDDLILKTEESSRMIKINKTPLCILTPKKSFILYNSTKNSRKNLLKMEKNLINNNPEKSVTSRKEECNSFFPTKLNPSKLNSLNTSRTKKEIIQCPPIINKNKKILIHKKNRKSNSFDDKINKQIELNGNSIFGKLLQKYQKFHLLIKNLNQESKISIKKDISFPYINYQLIDDANFSPTNKKNELITDELLIKNKTKSFKFKDNVKNLKKDTSNIIIKNKTLRKINKLSDYYMKYKKAIITAAIHFKELKISLRDFLTKNNKIEPYDKSKFDLFLLNIKNGDIALVEKKLFYNKFLVYNYDEFFQTPLHWATKRDHYKLIPILLKHGGLIDAQDYLGNTPLILASLYSRYNSIKVLLKASANPLIINKEGKNSLNVSKDEKIKKLLIIHTQILMIKPSKFNINY